MHSGVGAPYAHVTAPLRRLVDRFGTEVCLALAAGRGARAGLRAALPELPGLMTASDRRTRDVERAVVDATEAWPLHGREGQSFSAVVVDVEDGAYRGRAPSSSTSSPCVADARATDSPPARACPSGSAEADVAARKVRFELDGAA